MNDQTQNQAAAPEGVNELAMLKQRADMMGVKYSNNIGLETLRQKVKDAIEGAEQDAPKPEELSDPSADPAVKKLTLREQILAENMKLVRCRITCLNPNKKELPGEIYTVANEYLGTVSKFIPYGEVTDDGYHIPYCLYTNLKDRKFLDIRSKKDPKTGQIKVSTGWAQEFAIDVLPQLTPAQLKDLAIAQLQAGN